MLRSRFQNCQMTSRTSTYSTLLVALFIAAQLHTHCDAIGCFKCRSEGLPGDPRYDRNCEDQFNHTKYYYQDNCFAGRKERVGVFPATQCIKLLIKDPKKQMVVRDCVVDNGGFSAETEIGRISHCGFFTKVEMLNTKYRGCLMACNTDGCNASPTAASPTLALLALLSGVAALSFCSFRAFGGGG